MDQAFTNPIRNPAINRLRIVMQTAIEIHHSGFEKQRHGDEAQSHEPCADFVRQFHALHLLLPSSRQRKTPPTQLNAWMGFVKSRSRDRLADIHIQEFIEVDIGSRIDNRFVARLLPIHENADIQLLRVALGDKHVKQLDPEFIRNRRE